MGSYIRYFWTCWFVIFLSIPSFAQVSTPSEWEESAEELNVENNEIEEKDWNNYLEELAFLKENPFNLNRITKEQLELFPFLTDLQIEHLLYYIYVFGPMKTIYELQLVEDWDRQTIQFILPYVYVGDPEKKKRNYRLSDYWKYGKQECVSRLDIPFYKKIGYKQPGDNLLTIDNSKHYLGSAYASILRYSFHYKDELYAGFTASKDAGEPFFSKGNYRGFDSYSFYFLARNIGKIKTLAVGNYRLNFGKGIVINSDYSLGKSVTIATMESKSTGIKRHSSADEYNYFQGLATTIKLMDLELSAFYSHRNLDGKVVNGVLTSIKKDGLHKLPIDFERKNTATIQLVGGNINYTFKRLKIGATAIYYFFDRQYIPEEHSYNYYTLKGNKFYNIGLDYKYRWHNISFSGELAMGIGGGMATINSVSFSPISGYKLLLLHRYYAKEYKALYGRSVSEGTSVQNENGTYFGIEIKPIKYWKMFVYADFFHFPWLKYGVSSPSNGFDGLAQIVYTPKTNTIFSLAYRYKIKEKDITLNTAKNKETNNYIQHKIKGQFSYLMVDNILLKTTIIWSFQDAVNASNEHGLMLMQSVSYRFSKLPLSIDGYYGMFDTNSYSTRISSYEKGLIYSFSVPSFYGKGVRLALNFRYDLSKKIMMMIKYGQTRYTDRDKIGTSLEMIHGNVKADMNILFRCKF